ncbi:hypothetical protein ACLOJK_025916 [Asimina triloba]
MSYGCRIRCFAGSELTQLHCEEEILFKREQAWDYFDCISCLLRFVPRRNRTQLCRMLGEAEFNDLLDQEFMLKGKWYQRKDLEGKCLTWGNSLLFE